MIDVTSHLARWSQTLAGLAQTGLAFSNSTFDVERYQELLRLAAEMSAKLNAQALFDPTLADHLVEGWRQQVQPGFAGYASPKVRCGAIVFNTHDEF